MADKGVDGFEMDQKRVDLSVDIDRRSGHQSQDDYDFRLGRSVRELAICIKERVSYQNFLLRLILLNFGFELSKTFLHGGELLRTL